jgi:hypothetical protein
LSDGKILVIVNPSCTGVNSISRCGPSWRQHRPVFESDQCDTGLAATLQQGITGVSYGIKCRLHSKERESMLLGRPMVPNNPSGDQCHYSALLQPVLIRHLSIMRYDRFRCLFSDRYHTTPDPRPDTTTDHRAGPPLPRPPRHSHLFVDIQASTTLSVPPKTTISGACST